MDPDSFTSAHQRSIGIALSLMEGLVRSLRADGLRDEALAQLEAALAEVAEATGASKPSPRPGELQAKLAQLLVHAMELDSHHLKAYGELPVEAREYLDEQSQRLSALTLRLTDAAQGGT